MAKKSQNARELTEEENAAIAAAKIEGENTADDPGDDTKDDAADEVAPDPEVDAAIAAAILAKSKENPDLLTDEERLLLEDLNKENDVDDREEWEKPGYVAKKITPEDHWKKGQTMTKEVVKTLNAMILAFENFGKEAAMNNIDPAPVIRTVLGSLELSRMKIVNFDFENFGNIA
jgi:hypothetical protein